MTYFAADAKGYVGDIGTTSGWIAFAAWARKQGGEIAILGEDGQTLHPRQLAKELRTAKTDNESDEEVRVALLDAATEADEILIVTDGMAEKFAPGTEMRKGIDDSADSDPDEPPKR